MGNKTTTCMENKNADVRIVALSKSINAELMKTIKKAWKLNPDKRLIDLIPVTGIDCVNEGYEQQ